MEDNLDVLLMYLPNKIFALLFFAHLLYSMSFILNF